MAGLPIITHEYIVKGSGTISGLDDPLSEDILRSMKASPNHSYVEPHSGRTITNKVLLEQMVAVAEWMKSKGLKPDDVIAIGSENRIEFAVPLAATLFIGGTVNTLNPLYTIDELKHVLSISKPKIIFCSPFMAPKIKEIKGYFSFIREIVLFDHGMDPVDGFTSFTQIIKKNVNLNVNSFRCEKVNARKSIAAILCSSGTTGLPKCVELSHANFRCFLALTEVSGVAGNVTEETSVILGLVPFFHGYGFGLLIASLILNIQIIILPKFDEEIFLSSIEKYRISSLHIVPPLALFLAKHPLVDKYDLSCVKTIVCGAAPLSSELENEVKKRIKSVEVMRQAYGMTELSVASTIAPADKIKVGSVGVPAPGIDFKIIDVDTGKALPPFKEGELCFKGPYVMNGYRDNPSATASTIDPEGWLHTGDVGYYDEDGYVFIVDRLKELIKYKGFQVPPAELEAILQTNPKIKDAAVIGFPDDEAGELPMAFVVLAPGAQATEDEIKKFVAVKVSPQKKIHFVRFVDEIPKNPSGKILRKELRKLLTKSKL